MIQFFNRYEFKYLIPNKLYGSILNKLYSYNMSYDPYANKADSKSYSVTSLYFDSPALSDYNDKVGGFLDRKKIRIRIYTPTLKPETREIWLEKKEKHDMRVAKKRIKITLEEYNELINGSIYNLKSLFNNSRNGKEIFYNIVSERLRPHIIVRYSRQPLVSDKFKDIRITLDRQIESCLSNNLCYTPLMTSVHRNTFVMEIKFSKILPYWFKNIICKYNLRRDSFSKYANSVEVLYKYHPIPR